MRVPSYIYLICCVALGCQPPAELGYQEMVGQTMGTYYAVKYQPAKRAVEVADIEIILDDLNKALSTYDPSSVISRFNRNSDGITSDSIESEKLAEFFYENLAIAKSIYEITDGFFDPTVMPLVNYWGFGYQDRTERGIVDSTVVDSLVALVGFDKINLMDGTPFKVTKELASMQLDFSAIAKGYAVDQIAQFLLEHKVKNFFIDIGGENRAAGVNASGVPWKIGIATPDTNAAATSFDLIVHLDNRAIATSGNYRNFYEVDGQFISHTINPKSGYYERNTLLSASIIMVDCTQADALATACMAMGYPLAKQLIEKIPEVEGILIYQEGTGLPKYFEATSCKIEYLN